MYVNEKLKLNKFRQVNLPSGKDLFKRFGIFSGQCFTGDESIDFNARKLDSLGEISRQNDAALYDEYKEQLNKE